MYVDTVILSEVLESEKVIKSIGAEHVFLNDFERKSIVKKG